LPNDETYMYRCLQLAQLGAGYVAPNPMVGAVLVNDNKIIGEGYHKIYGEAHAEVNCINSVSKHHIGLISKATLYVSLEPCAHYGKTPPCADTIIKNNIKKVVVGCRDIYKEVDGKGIKKLQAAGVHVIIGILEKECIEVNKRFFTFHQKKRPYIILKWAQSLNGKISGSQPSPGKRTFISNEYTNRVVHKWRTEEAAIMIGTNTALNDNPLLTARLWKGQNPVRVIFDNNLRLPAYLKIFNKEIKTIILNKIKYGEDEDILYHKLETNNTLKEAMDVLYKMNIQSVLVEGGAKLLQSFIDNNLWDEARNICNSEMMIKDGIKAPGLNEALLQKTENYFGNIIYYLKPVV
jgi:diaminohydroxyphosphoribosylaminopyrimidine deaminase/5-amino-6-(5-phosphoribosylamino)uracil reductase